MNKITWLVALSKFTSADDITCRMASRVTASTPGQDPARRPVSDVEMGSHSICMGRAIACGRGECGTSKGRDESWTSVYFMHYCVVQHAFGHAIWQWQSMARLLGPCSATLEWSPFWGCVATPRPLSIDLLASRLRFPLCCSRWCQCRELQLEERQWKH